MVAFGIAILTPIILTLTLRPSNDAFAIILAIGAWAIAICDKLDEIKKGVK